MGFHSSIKRKKCRIGYIGCIYSLKAHHSHNLKKPFNMDGTKKSLSYYWIYGIYICRDTHWVLLEIPTWEHSTNQTNKQTRRNNNDDVFRRDFPLWFLFDSITNSHTLKQQTAKSQKLWIFVEINWKTFFHEQKLEKFRNISLN